MRSFTLTPERRFFVRSISIGLIVVGIVVFAGALANTMFSSAPSSNLSGPHQFAMPTVASVESTETTASTDTGGDTEATSERGSYPAKPARGQTLGVLIIPALGQKFPIVEGTGDAELKRGVGHMVQTAMPGEPDNCVISGHRDTVFSRLGDLEKGDRLLVETATGTHTYKITKIRIVDKDDRTVVVSTDHAQLTVSTCYPFRYVGSAPKRYVLIASLVND